MDETDAMDDAGLSRDACAGFWAQVAADQDALARMDSMELMEHLNAMLEPLVDGVAMEVSGERGGHRELVLTAHGSLERFAAVQALAAQAPALAGFSVTPFRRRTSGDFGMRMDGFELSTGDVLVQHGPEAGQVALQVGFAKEIPADMWDHARNMAFIMLDHMLGEYDFAVKVGPVDFVEGGELSSPVALHEFAPLLDACWAGELGHAGGFPAGDHEWTGLDVESESTGEELLVLRNDSANALVGRADLTWRITVALPVPTQDALDVVREYADRLSGLLEPAQAGICSHVVLDNYVRHMTWYVGDADAATRQAEQLLAQMQLQPEALQRGYDPSWQDYLQWAD
jgi:hypothetical protein